VREALLAAAGGVAGVGPAAGGMTAPHGSMTAFNAMRDGRLAGFRVFGSNLQASGRSSSSLSSAWTCSPPSLPLRSAASSRTHHHSRPGLPPHRRKRSSAGRASMCDANHLDEDIVLETRQHHIHHITPLDCVPCPKLLPVLPM
jgi:hypothetical protein